MPPKDTVDFSEAPSVTACKKYVNYTSVLNKYITIHDIHPPDLVSER